MTSTSTKHPKSSTSTKGGVSVYAAVDISPSMSGTKIEEVCQSLREIIKICPDYVLLDITVFSTTSKKLFTSLKSAISSQNVIDQIKLNCGMEFSTALYDAWGDLLTSIPDSVWRKDDLQIFILTDGEDNASKRYTKASVLELTNSKLTLRSKFNFIQVGKQANADIVQSLKQICQAKSQNTIQTHVVDDNATGIKTAMSSVRDDIISSTRPRATSASTKEQHGHATRSSAAVGSKTQLSTIKSSREPDTRSTMKTNHSIKLTSTSSTNPGSFVLTANNTETARVTDSLKSLNLASEKESKTTSSKNLTSSKASTSKSNASTFKLQ